MQTWQRSPCRLILKAVSVLASLCATSHFTTRERCPPRARLTQYCRLVTQCIHYATPPRSQPCRPPRRSPLRCHPSHHSRLPLSAPPSQSPRPPLMPRLCSQHRLRLHRPCRLSTASRRSRSLRRRRSVGCCPDCTAAAHSPPSATRSWRRSGCGAVCTCPSMHCRPASCSSANSTASTCSCCARPARPTRPCPHPPPPSLIRCPSHAALRLTTARRCPHRRCLCC